MPRKERQPRPPRPPKAEKIRRKALGPDGKIHVPKIMTPDPMIFPPRLRLALMYFLETLPHDAERAARRADMDPEEFKKHMHSPGVRQWVKQQEDTILDKWSDHVARKLILNEDYLDARTVDLLEGKKVPASVKARMIEVGYKRFGMLKEKVEASGPGGAPLAFELVRIGAKKKDGDGQE